MSLADNSEKINAKTIILFLIRKHSVYQRLTSFYFSAFDSVIIGQYVLAATNASNLFSILPNSFDKDLKQQILKKKQQPRFPEFINFREL